MNSPSRHATIWRDGIACSLLLPLRPACPADFLSQLLISPAVMLRLGLAPFALVQATAMWAWFCLHAKRLRDADRPLSPAVAIAVLYALGMILLLLIIALLVGMAPGGVEAPRGAATD